MEPAVNERLEAALRYVELQLPIIPICSPHHEGMSLSHRQFCASPGKSPILKNWTEHKSTTREEVLEWFRKNENINIGLVLGDTGFWNLVGIDIDGELGEKLLREWSSGVLPVTWEFTTGKGRRLLYLLPEGAASRRFTGRDKNQQGELLLLAEGQQTVLPPSRHPSGRAYQWVEGRSPSDITIAEAPQWLLNRVLVYETDEEATMSPPVEMEDWARTVNVGERNSHLVKLAGSLLARGTIPKEEVCLFLKAWNIKHCDPPLPEDEIEKMVEGLAAAEEMKSIKRKSRSNKEKEVLRPSVFAEYFVNKQKERGYSWKYCVNKGLFYFCDDHVGPWIPRDIVFMQKEVRSALIDHNLEWDKMYYVNEVINALREYLADPQFEDVFDIGKYPDLIHIYVNNGMLDWRTLTLKPWDPSSYSTIKLPVDWNAEARSNEAYELWQRTLAEWVPDEGTRLFLQEFIGYCLIPDCSFRTAVFLYGVGSNGKSLFLDVISKLFGGHISFIPLHRIADRFETAGLIDKLINVCGDIDAKYLDETSVLKAIIAGDAIRGEYKHGKSFDFKPVARLMFSANTLPKVSDKSEGWYSRWKFVEFPNQFKVDPAYKRNLLSTFSAPDALSALLCWAMEGLQRLYGNERFTESESMKVSEMQYRSENDSVTAFVQGCLEQVAHEGASTTMSTQSLHRVYKYWCDEQSLKPVSQVEFVRRLSVLGFRRGVRQINKVSTNCVLGVRFVEPAQQEWNLAEQYNLEESLRLATVKRR